MPRPPAGPRAADTNLGIRDPRVDVAHSGYSVLVTRVTGTFGEGAEEGLFDFDCRVLSWWHLAIDGTPPEFVSALPSRGPRWGAVLRVKTGAPKREASGPKLPQDAVEIRARRTVGRGMREHLRFANNSMAPWSGEVSLELGATFADAVEAPTPDAPQRGTTTASWDEDARAITFRFEDAEGELRVERGVRTTLDLPSEAGTPSCEPATPSRARPLVDGSREVAMVLRFRLELPPRGIAEIALEHASLVDGEWRTPLREDGDETDPGVRATAVETWMTRCLTDGVRVDSANPSLDRTLEVARRDLLELRNQDLEGDSDGSWVPNAGVPTYTGIFGRDTLIAGMQSLAFGPEPLDGALRWMAATQGRAYDEAIEEQPGRMLHELRRGPMADLRLIPQHRYYGAHTTSTLFPVALAEHWLWTGDLAAVRRFLPAARRALVWAARDGDSDGDGFLEYRGGTPGGLKNEAWKDSSEAIRYPDGRLVENPIATVEEQVFHLAALESVAGLLVATGEDEEAAGLRARARDLRARWHEAYWMADEGWYALALDPSKRQVRTVASNPGHAFAAGAVPWEVAGRVADRLLAPDLASGWGVRTLSTEHPAYNPLAYHLGTVWPFENAMFVAGLRAYGCDDQAERISTALLTAAAHFRESRLPELFGGHGRDEQEVPTVYSDSNVTQAWTASAMASLLATMTGLRPLAPMGLLALVRPRLPAWLPSLTIHRLPVGDGSVSLRFERGPDGRTDHEVLATTGSIQVRRTDALPGEAGPGSDVLQLVDGPDGRGDERVARAIRTRLLGARADG